MSWFLAPIFLARAWGRYVYRALGKANEHLEVVRHMWPTVAKVNKADNRTRIGWGPGAAVMVDRYDFKAELT